MTFVVAYIAHLCIHVWFYSVLSRYRRYLRVVIQHSFASGNTVPAGEASRTTNASGHGTRRERGAAAAISVADAHSADGAATIRRTARVHIAGWAEACAAAHHQCNAIWRTATAACYQRAAHVTATRVSVCKVPSDVIASR